MGEIDLSGISPAKSGLIQVVADNFDADISAQNGKLSTHSLALLVTQNQQGGILTATHQTIKLINKGQMVEPVAYDDHIYRFNVPKTPETSPKQLPNVFCL